MKTTDKKKLQLKRETVRTLNNDEMTKVGGGSVWGVNTSIPRKSADSRCPPGPPNIQ